MKVLTPLTYSDPSCPLIFLAGPVRGGDNWQKEAISILSQEELCISSPAREGEGDIARLSDQDLRAQAEWESHYLELAGQTGAILFWLPCQREERKRGSYAQTTRIELGLWLARAKYGANVVVGAEEGFPGRRYIGYQVECHGLSLCDTLAETCHEALILARRD